LIYDGNGRATPGGQITTVNFHAEEDGPAGQCGFVGTAVTSG
jgi:hypothetical protein